jgi:hypothetical protein
MILRTTKFLFDLLNMILKLKIYTPRFISGSYCSDSLGGCGGILLFFWKKGHLAFKQTFRMVAFNCIVAQQFSVVFLMTGYYT